MLKTNEKNNNNSSKLIRGEEKKKRDGLKSKMWRKTRKNGKERRGGQQNWF